MDENGTLAASRYDRARLHNYDLERALRSGIPVLGSLWPCRPGHDDTAAICIWAVWCDLDRIHLLAEIYAPGDRRQAVLLWQGGYLFELRHHVTVARLRDNPAEQLSLI